MRARKERFPIEPFSYSVEEVAIIEAIGRTDVYRRIAAGEYTAHKDGKRLRVTAESIKRRQASLPRAVIKPDDRVLKQLAAKAADEDAAKAEQSAEDLREPAG
jgi:hypothetical protein